MSYDPEKRKGAYIFSNRVRRFQICRQCIMDTTDPEIEFDENGICNRCHDYDQRISTEVFRGQLGRQKLAAIIAQIKDEGKGKRYDCVLGLSGGVDSTYTAYLTKKVGLRPLAVHMDNGWNSEIAVRNIENIVRILGMDLYTHVLDWEEFRRIQLAFLRASTPDSEIPTDHAIVATLYQAAAKQGVRWIMDGSNVVTEIMVPATWSHGHSDWGYIKNLNKVFGGKKLSTYPHYSFYKLFWYREIKKIQRFPILNYVDYNKMEAMETLKKELGWVSYGGKHYESIYTRFYQGYILPEKFGFDKRKSHLSCLVRNGRLTREQALIEIQNPPIEKEQVREDRDFVVKKLGIIEEEFEKIMKAPRKTFWDYPSDERDIYTTRTYRFLWRCYMAKQAAGSYGGFLLGFVSETVVELGRFVLDAPKQMREKPLEFMQDVSRALMKRGLRVILVFLWPAVLICGAVARRMLPRSAFEKLKSGFRWLNSLSVGGG